MTYGRRPFLKGCCAAIAATVGARLRLVGAQPARDPSTLVVLSMRGGWDALSLFPPADGDDRGHYERARPNLKIPTRELLALSAQFGMHPALRPLYELYQGGHLAVVCATGLVSDTRSHFEAIEYIERGTPGRKDTQTGWIGRHLGADASTFSAIGLGAPPSSLLGSQSICLGSVDEFALDLSDEQRAQLIEMYAGTSLVQRTGQATLAALQEALARLAAPYRPSPGVAYPDSEWGRTLAEVARLLQPGWGTRVITAELGGWDTHLYQSDLLTALAADFAQGLLALYQDLEHTGAAQRTTIVVLSEFGRRLQENASAGTDHGHGGAMLVVGGRVRGRRVLGHWPGLNHAQLYDGADLAVTTDYRQVLTEVLSQGSSGAVDPAHIFPGYKEYVPLGLIASEASF